MRSEVMSKVISVRIENSWKKWVNAVLVQGGCLPDHEDFTIRLLLA
jgi:hypothetical protein